MPLAQQFNSFIHETGCLIGSYVGNAVGGSLVFMIKKDITDDLVNDAMRLRGGGISKLQPGQITGPFSINMCFMDALSKG